MIRVKKCKNCNKEFEFKKNTAKFCSEDCRKEAWSKTKFGSKYNTNKAVEKECEFCKTSFKTRLTKQRYCSDYCRKKDKYKPRGSEKIKKKCVNCGTEFMAAYNTRKYCGRACFNKHRVKKKAPTSITRLLPFERDILHIKASKLIAVGEYQRAIDLYTRLIMSDINNTQYLMNRGVCFYFNKDYYNALNDYNRVVRLDPKNKRGYQHRIKVYKKMEHKKRLIKHDLKKIKSLGK